MDTNTLEETDNHQSLEELLSPRKITSFTDTLTLKIVERKGTTMKDSKLDMLCSQKQKNNKLLHQHCNTNKQIYAKTP